MPKIWKFPMSQENFNYLLFFTNFFLKMLPFHEKTFHEKTQKSWSYKNCIHQKNWCPPKKIFFFIKKFFFSLGINFFGKLRNTKCIAPRILWRKKIFFWWAPIFLHKNRGAMQIVCLNLRKKNWCPPKKNFFFHKKLCF